ncbi:EsaB/YukD family protein [Paenibacillus sp. 481]|uniref:EsaB/YukD family protein n=1 Tax=Paenibacillus sp. 481 TaxID=2835869 RepID=UPI001E4DCA4B|nr:EsaB/YukD family protein [Paenibacillus sp. 481]UHA72078.1 hypothetical protein KIK04_15345 [Paenibacillus sp. 481]
MSLTIVTLKWKPVTTTVDVQLSAHISLEDMLPYMLTALGVPLYEEYGHVRYDYESSWDAERWEPLDERRSLRDQNVYDGMYIRLTKYVSYSSSLLDQPAWIHDRLPLFEL